MMRQLLPPPPSVPPLAIALAAALLLAACAGEPAAPESPAAGGARQAEPLSVAVSLPPQAWLADRLGGERVRTTVLLQPGRSYHAFEPAPRESLALGQARLYLAVGHPDLRFERALLDSLPNGTRPEVVSWTRAADAAPARGADPHLWLDPEAMTAAARATAAALSRLDPAHQSDYQAGLETVLAEIAAAEREVAALLAPARGGAVVVYHPAWGGLLRRYGLSEEAIEHDGKPPSPRHLAALIESARSRGVATVFVQPGLPEPATRALAGEIGARVVELDPLAYDWADNLRRAARAFAAAAVEPAPAAPLQPAAAPEDRDR